MATWNVGEKNGFWKGGRTIASNGYVLVRVGLEHHLADSRGYAYEHRLVAEEKLGRRLGPREQVHHINSNKTDNRPENLQVVESVAHHQVLHRRLDSRQRMPGEVNPLVACACGCGESFLKYDEEGRPRQYVSGHNPPVAPTMARIVAILRDGPMSTAAICDAFGNPQAAKTALSRLKHRGTVDNLRRGVWRLTNHRLFKSDVAALEALWPSLIDFPDGEDLFERYPISGLGKDGN